MSNELPYIIRKFVRSHADPFRLLTRDIVTKSILTSEEVGGVSALLHHYIIMMSALAAP
jgi:hypothetical protein